MSLLPKSQREQAMVLCCIVAVALAAVYWNYVYSPKAADLAVRTERVDTLEARNIRARESVSAASTEQLRAEAEQATRDLEVMRQLVPTGSEVPALLEQVSTAARRVGLDLASVQPQPVIEGEQFDTYRYKLAVTGSYHDLAQFLTNVGSLGRIVAPINLALSPVTNPQTTAVQRRDEGDSALETKFEIQTYVSKTPAPRGGKS